MHLLAILEIMAQVFFIHHAIQRNKSRYWIAFLLIPWIGFLVYFFTEWISGQGQANAPMGNLDASPAPVSVKGRQMAYISQGKLFQLTDGAPAEPFQSPFGQKLIDQTLRIHQKNEWKTQGAGSHFGGAALWGVEAVNADAIKVNITSVAQCPDDERLFYFLETDSAGGLFAGHPGTKAETRLFHKEKFKGRDLDIHPETKEFVCSRQFANGTASITLISPDGTDMKILTEGDAMDDCPSWIPGKGRRILFQSSGIARNTDGYAIGRGAAAIQALDLDQQRMTTVLENPQYDFLQPHISVDGYLYYIRRPYEMNTYGPMTAVLDFILFPFRLLRAVFHYLNFFSLVYSRKPLTTASGPKMAGDDLKTIMLKGKVIDAEKALRKGARIMGVPSLVPASWVLIRRDENDNETILAAHVASFDISRNGTLIYSNGYGIFELDPQKRQALLLKDKLIEDVIIA